MFQGSVQVSRRPSQRQDRVCSFGHPVGVLDQPAVNFHDQWACHARRATSCTRSGLPRLHASRPGRRRLTQASIHLPPDPNWGDQAAIWVIPTPVSVGKQRTILRDHDRDPARNKDPEGFTVSAAGHPSRSRRAASSARDREAFSGGRDRPHPSPGGRGGAAATVFGQSVDTGTKSVSSMTVLGQSVDHGWQQRFRDAGRGTRDTGSMGRRNRRAADGSTRAWQPRDGRTVPARTDGASLSSVGGYERVESRPDGDWIVRSVTGSAATRSYRCPGCQQTIPPARPHVVAWPAVPGLMSESGVDERRHWHTGCWQSSARRGG